MTETGFLTFFVIWIAVGVISTAFLYFSNDVALKRKNISFEI